MMIRIPYAYYLYLILIQGGQKTCVTIQQKFLEKKIRRYEEEDKRYEDETFTP